MPDNTNENIKNDEVVEDEVVEENNDTDTNETTSEKKKKKEKKSKELDKIEKLEAQIVALQNEVANWKNEYLKAHAETENFKRRTNEQAIKDRKYASQKVIGELIQPVDMLLQIVNMPASSPEVANYLIGFQMIANQLAEILKAEGLAPIDALNKEFDPNVMHAVQTEEDLEKENNIVLRVMQPGYMFKDRVLRPAMVVVNKKNLEKKED